MNDPVGSRSSLRGVLFKNDRRGLGGGGRRGGQFGTMCLHFIGLNSIFSNTHVPCGDSDVSTSFCHLPALAESTSFTLSFSTANTFLCFLSFKGTHCKRSHTQYLASCAEFSRQYPRQTVLLKQSANSRSVIAWARRFFRAVL